MRRLEKARVAYALISIALIGISHSVVLPSAHSAPREVTITLGADDNLSGVALMQIAENKNNPPAAIAFSRTSVVTTEANILWVRVQDRALNWSTWVEVQVGGAPVTRDPLAKTVYVPVEIVPYVPTPSTPTPTPSTPTPTPSTPTPTPPAISSTPISDTPPPAITAPAETETVTVKTETETVKVITEIVKAETATASVQVTEKPSAATPSVNAEVLVTKAPSAPAGIKEIPAQTKPAVSVSVSSAPKSEVKVGVNKVLELKMPSTSGATSVKASITDATGKKLNLDVKVDKKTGKITMPKLSFSKKGTYVISTTIGKKTIKVSVTVR
jgi:hypothetical protein